MGLGQQSQWGRLALEHCKALLPSLLGLCWPPSFLPSSQGHQTRFPISSALHAGADVKAQWVQGMALRRLCHLMGGRGEGCRGTFGSGAFLEILSLGPMPPAPNSKSWFCWQGPDLYRM